MTTTQTTADLVRAALAGDGGALGALVSRHQRASLGYALGRLPDEAEARDAVQDALIEACLQLDRLREPAAFPGWLRRIVHKQCDRRLRRWRERPTDRAFAGEPPALDAALDAAARWRAVRRGLDALPEHERVVVALHHLGGVPVREAAAFLEISPGAVKTRLSRARARLRTEEAPMPSPRPKTRPDPPGGVDLFLAIHRGDRAGARGIAAARPALLEAEETWTDEEALTGGYPLAHPRTPLMAAAAAGDPELVRDLLALGADPDGRCRCDNGEPAVWVAARFGHPGVVRALLQAGADPGARHRSGMDLAGLRAWRGGPAPSALALGGDGRLHTGIGAIDLWLRPRAGDLVRVSGPAETGLMVLLSELTHAFGAAGGAAVWTSWLPGAWHWRQLEGVARRAAVERHARIVTPATAGVAGPEDVLPAALERLSTMPGPRLHVVFEQPGHAVDLQAHLPRLRRGATLTLVVRPWAAVTRGDPADSSWEAGAQGWLHTAPALAARGLWPAVDPARTRSRRPDTPLAAQARAAIASHGLDAGPGHAVLRALLQPFHAARPDTGCPAVAWDEGTLAARVQAALEPGAPG